MWFSWDVYPSGNMKSPSQICLFYLELMSNLLADICEGHQKSESRRNYETFRRRFQNEGLLFATCALPKLGKALDSALETHLFFSPMGFATQKGTKLPRFLHGHFKRVFHSDGVLLDNPCVYSIQEIRQFCYFLYKLEVNTSEGAQDEAIQRFKAAEADLAIASFGHVDARIVYRAQELLEKLFKGYDPKKILPGHGPGSVNTGEKGLQKWSFKRLYNQIHQCYPYYDYFVCRSREAILDRVKWFRSLKREDSARSKVCLVPKDSRGPRVISVEPLEVQFIQQGQMRSLVRLIERHPLTRGVVNFTKQDYNREEALRSSLTREFATLDLKEASDRVHLNLVRLLFPDEVVKHLIATRSQGTVLPNGEYLEFRKFAPMGSANCFPVMALTLWSLIRAYCDTNGLEFRGLVYGDDIIVPTDHADDISAMLEGFNLRVNWDKSFSRGFFRESCGVDAYRGVDVTPVRLRRPWSAKSRDSSCYASYSSLIEPLFARGLWKAADFVRKSCEAVYGEIPYGTANAGYPSLVCSDPFLAERLTSIKHRRRWCDVLQRWEYLLWVPKDTPGNKFPFSGWERALCSLLTNQLEGEDSPRVVFRSSTKLVRKWVPIR